MDPKAEAWLSGPCPGLRRLEGALYLPKESQAWVGVYWFRVWGLGF